MEPIIVKDHIKHTYVMTPPFSYLQYFEISKTLTWETEDTVMATSEVLLYQKQD